MTDNDNNVENNVPVSVTFDTSVLDNVLKQISDIDAEITKAKGTQAERVRKATEAVKAASPELFKILEAAETALAEAKQNIDDAVSAAIKSLALPSDKLDALRKQREQAVVLANGLAVVFQAQGVSVSVDIPSAPKTSGGGGGTRSVKTSTVEHYIVKPGQTDWQVFANDTFSYLAFHFGLTKDGLGGTDLLAKLVSDAGISDRTKPWYCDITLPVGKYAGKTFGIGMRTVNTPTDTPTDNTADNTADNVG